MARTKSAGSAEENKVAKVSGEVGRPSQSVAAIREQYKIEAERQKANYASASEDKVMRTIRDVTKNATTTTLTATDKERISTWLTGNIYANTANLITASQYLYLRSPIYQEMIDLFASMYCFDCRIIQPPYTFAKGLDANKSLKQMDDTLNLLDILSLKYNLQGAMTNMWIADVSFNLAFRDDVGSFFWPIDPSEAIIDSVYIADGGYCYGMALDMSKWRSTQRQSLIEWLGEPLISMWQEYQRTNVKYVHVPAEYSFVVKKRVNDMQSIIPPMLPYLNQLASLNDLIDTQNAADSLSFYRMIYLPLKTISSSKTSDDFQISPDLAIDYFKIASDTAIPSGVSSAVIPGDELKTIDFSDSVKEDTNRVESSQDQILGAMSGMGALINANKAINNTELIKNALRAESAYALHGVLGQIEAWTNLQLSLELSNYCHISYLPVTIYTKEDYRKTLLESLQHGYQYRLAYGTLLGISERQTMASIYFEQEALKLPELMQCPLQSSYTTSNTGKTSGEVGRPEKDAGELSPSGERSRNS